MIQPSPTVTVFHDERALARTLAQRIADDVRRQPGLVLGLATGRTPVRLYHELGALHARRDVDFSRVVTFNLAGISPRGRAATARSWSITCSRAWESRHPR